jgi:hypothetical protein
MFQIPRIRLRTIFLLFLCIGIGLTCALAPPAEADEFLQSLNVYAPQLNWHYALLSAASVAMTIGLLQQVWQLASTKQKLELDLSEEQFAVAMGIAWRSTVAIAIATCLMLKLLISRRIFELPKHEVTLVTTILPDVLWVTCVIVVLSESVMRWQAVARRQDARFMTPIVWVTGVILALLVVPDVALVTWLVHLATEGIERYAPLALQRQGAFPDHQAEGFRLFWSSLGVVCCVLLAAILIRPICRTVGKARWLLIGAYAALVLASAIFCAWYYVIERHRISPDLSSVGLASNWSDWLGGCALTFMFITIGSYRLTESTSLLRVAEYDVKTREHLGFHESFGCLILLAVAGILYFLEMIRAAVSGINLLGPPSFAETAVYLFKDPNFLLYFSVCFLSLKLCWLRWRRRNDQVAWDLPVIKKKDFLSSWVLLALVTIVAIPTTSIFAFVYWLGPWFLYK